MMDSQMRQELANDLLRVLNRKVFRNEIDIEKLPKGVGIVEDFWQAAYAAGRSAGLEEIKRLQLLIDKVGRRERRERYGAADPDNKWAGERAAILQRKEQR